MRDLECSPENRLVEQTEMPGGGVGGRSSQVVVVVVVVVVEEDMHSPTDGRTDEV